jgi:tetratricopeptide (TPR) repeat protein
VAEAVSAYLRALRINPDDFQANLNLSTAYYQLSENAQALPYAERAVTLDPKDGPARLNLGTVYSALGRDREAVLEYQQAAELMALTPSLLINLAEALGRLGRYEEMVNTLGELIKTEPTPLAHERLGFAHFRMKKYPEARAQFEAALRIDPDYFPALNGLGVCELNTWLWSDRKDEAARERALGALRRSLQINRKQPRIEELLSRFR